MCVFRSLVLFKHFDALLVWHFLHHPVVSLSVSIHGLIGKMTWNQELVVISGQTRAV